MKQPLSVNQIVQLASAYYGSCVLFAALQSDVFSLIESYPEGAADAFALAQQGGFDKRGLRLLLDGCVACGLLHKEGDKYTNTEASRLALVQGAPQDLTRAVRYNHDVYGAWGKLHQFVQTGKPVENPAKHLGDDPERTRRFVIAMHARAMAIGRAIVPMLSFSPDSHVLDLAGGPGTYAVLIAEANPGLTCETRDLPAVSAVATELVQQSSVAQRVKCFPGDYHKDTYERETYDAVTIFGALHQESPEQIKQILNNAYHALKVPGRIYILDMMTDASHTNPSFSALFGINMALTMEHGWVFSDIELHSWLTEAGFHHCQTRQAPAPMPHWLVSAEKRT